MPFTVTAIGTNTNTTGATIAVTVPAGGVPAGALIVVSVTDKSTSGTGSTADTATNTYASTQSGNLAATVADGLGTMFTVTNCKALVNGNTITYTKAVSGSIAAISAIYVVGVANLSPISNETSGQATGTTGTITVTSGVPNTPEDLFIGVLCDSGTTTAGGNATFTQASGWLPAGGFEANSGGSGNARVDMGYKQQIGAEVTVTYAPSLSSTAQQWFLSIIGFRIAQEPAAFQQDLLNQNKVIEVIGYRCG